MYRYSRGQSGQNSLPRPTWGSGSHGTRAASPEPGVASTGVAGTSLGSSNDAPKERMGTTQQDEAILNLEAELEQLRSVCASKDQRIAELSRTDTPAGRLKRDIRNLSSELHNARRQLKESLAEIQELQAQLSRAEAGASGREGSSHDAVSHDAGDSPISRAAGDSAPTSSGASASRGSGVDKSNGAGADRANLRERIAELSEENRQLRETVVQLKGLEGVHHASQPSGASTQRSVEPCGNGAMGGRENTGTFSSSAARQAYISGQPPAGSSAQVAAAPNPQQEEPVKTVVYSSANPENAATIGPTMLQGVGTVDGVASIAKVLLQRIHSSVCCVRRPGVPGQAHVLPTAGQMPMIGVGMPSNM